MKKKKKSKQTTGYKKRKKKETQETKMGHELQNKQWSEGQSPLNSQDGIRTKQNNVKSRNKCKKQASQFFYHAFGRWGWVLEFVRCSLLGG
jgi:hypothetical protein